MDDADGSHVQPELEAKLQLHEAELALMTSEADRQLADVGRRTDAAASRAAILVSSAAIASSVQMAGSANIWQVIAVAMSLTAALLAIPVLLFRKGQEVSINERLAKLYEWTPRRLELDVLKSKRAILARDQDALTRRASFLLFGYLSLAVAILFTGLQLTGLAR
jgi:hypothetical protein